MGLASEAHPNYCSGKSELNIIFFPDIEAEYQAFLAKKEETEKSYQDTQAELDGLMREVESFNNQLTVVIADEAVANDLVKTLPEEINLLEVKIESASKLLFSES